MYRPNTYNQNPNWQGDPYNQNNGYYPPQNNNGYNPYQNHPSFQQYYPQNLSQPQQQNNSFRNFNQQLQPASVITQEELIANHLEQTRKQRKYRQVPIRTKVVEDTHQELQRRLLGKVVEKSANSTNSSIVPVNIYVHKNQPVSPVQSEARKEIKTNPSFKNSQPFTSQQSAINPTLNNTDNKSFASKIESDNEILKSFSIKKKPNFSIYQKDFEPNKASAKTSKVSQTHSKFPKKISKRRTKVAAIISIFLLSASIFGISGFSYYQKFFKQTQPTVAGAMEVAKPKVVNYDEYKTWIESKNEGSFSEPGLDLDKDQLSNYEEFLISSNPISANTCDPKTSDSKNLFQLINPATCKPIDLKDENQAKLFGTLLSVSDSSQRFVESFVEDSKANSTVTNSSVLDLFGVKEYSEIDKITNESLDQKATQENLKKDYLKSIQKTKDYIDKYRSYETYDRNYDSPVHPAVYLEMSIKYGTPLKYMLAIARTESRFGTDRYTNSGALTRPGQFQNIYSMGLTDSGSNFGFMAWEEGVESFGKWYKKFQDRGVGDCNKWRIYNPNGDYCSKIENLAAEIEVFLKS